MLSLDYLQCLYAALTLSAICTLSVTFSLSIISIFSFFYFSHFYLHFTFPDWSSVSLASLLSFSPLGFLISQFTHPSVVSFQSFCLFFIISHFSTVFGLFFAWSLYHSWSWLLITSELTSPSSSTIISIHSIIFDLISGLFSNNDFSTTLRLSYIFLFFIIFLIFTILCRISFLNIFLFSVLLIAKSSYRC